MEAYEPFQRKKNSKWIGRSLQLRKLVKICVRNDPERAAILQALFSNEEIKTGNWQDLFPKKIDAQTVLTARRGTRIKEWEDQVKIVFDFSK